MDRMLVVVFDSETRVSEALGLLAALDDERAITVYAAGRVTKDGDGVVAVADFPASGSHDTVLAVPTRHLIDLLGRPATFSGPAVADLAEVGVQAEFMAEVRRRFPPGSAALVAEIEESSVLPVDVRMEQLGGDVMRQSRAPVADVLNYFQLAISADDAADMESEYARTSSDGRARLREPLTKAQVRLDAARSQAQCRIDGRRREAEAKIRLLRPRAANANDDRTETIERQIAAIRAEYVQWAAKLRAVWQIPTEALSI